MLDQNTIRKIKQAVGYKGRKVKIEQFKSGMSLNSYWDSGSRDYFWFVSLNNFYVKPVPQNGTPFDRLDLKTDNLEPNHVLVESSIIQGKQGTLRIYVA